MNKFAKVMCMLAVVALAFTACKKKENTVESFVFNGSFETFENSYEDDFEKMYLEGNQVTLENGDQWMIFNMGTTPHALLYTFNGTSFNSAPGYMNPDTDGHYYAFYPGQNAINADLANGKCTFRLDDQQQYRLLNGEVAVPQNALYMAAKDETARHLVDCNFQFKNICGILSLKLYSPTGKKVTSIEITDGKFNLVGDVTVNLDMVNPGELTTWFRNYTETESYIQSLGSYLQSIGYSVENEDNKVTLMCNADGVDLGLTSGTATRFLIVMRPLALLKGCTIKVNFTDGTSKTITSTKDNRISPNVIKNMTPVNVG